MEYELQLMRALAADFPVDAYNLYPRRAASLPGRRLRQVLKAVPDRRWNVTLRGFLPTVSLALRTTRPRGRQVVLIHHLDHSEVPRRGTSRGLETLFRRGLQGADRLVVVAPYWKTALGALAPGVPVTVIPNGFEVDRYGASPEDTAAFRRRHGFDDRPLIYLGNCQRAKGVVEAHEALRDGPWQMVTSGRPEVQLPVPNLDLDPAGYRVLLAACDVVLAMSRFREGWNRTAHEALLSGTPVVGRPQGGLGDLLESAGQRRVESAEELPVAVAAVLAEADALAERGRRFAREFTLERFSTGWRQLVVEELQLSHR